MTSYLAAIAFTRRGETDGVPSRRFGFSVNRTKQGHSAPTLTTRRVKDQNRQLQEGKMCITTALFRFSMIVTICLLILITPLIAQQTQVKPPTSRTQVVLLGTGTP